ncbi:MAG: ATP-grasp domain-containing protein [Acidobacteria bacterium]|nr:ATP-grasp domain-containing protein [Acidobacteriota bacterium]
MKILIAGVSVRAMAQSALRSGYSVIALDAFGDRDLIGAAESYSLRRDFQAVYSPEALLEAGRDMDLDAVAYASNLENHPGIIAGFGERCRVFGNAPDAVASVRNWPDLFGRLGRAGFCVPETVFGWETSPDPGRCWLLKPLLGGGGHGIRFYSPERKTRPENEGRYAAPGFMLQEYVPGRPCSAAFVANGKDCTVLGITEQLIGLRPFGAHGFRYTGTILPLAEMLDPDCRTVILEKIRRLAAFLTREYGLAGVNGIDFILRNGQVYLTEVNPRYSASMEVIEIAYGLPVFHLHLRSVLDKEIPGFDLEARLGHGKFYGKGYLFAEKDLTVPVTDGWLERGVRDVPRSGETIRRNGPVCTVLAAGPGRRKILADLILGAEALKKEIYG